MEYKKIICPNDCPASCGLLAQVDGNRILSVTGDPDHPLFHGMICGKMRHYERSIHSPKRILTPLKRTGKKGEGTFAPISWEEAVAEIKDRWQAILREDGGSAILPVYYSGVMSVIQRRCGDAFFNRMGARQMTMTLCSSAKGAAYQSVFGKTGCLDPREMKDSDLILVWGCNVKNTQIHTMSLLAEARRQGRRVLLVEVCAADMAAYCDEVFLIRPGSDGALALAMMHVLVEEGLADEAFLRTRAEGYEAFRATLPAYTPEWAQEITGLPAGRIRGLAREFGRAKAPAIQLGSGPSRRGNGGMNSRLIMILSAFTGAWGRPGAGYCGSNPGVGPYIDENRVKRPDFREKAREEAAALGRKFETASRIPNINLLGEALNWKEPGERVRSIYVYGSNPALSVSDQKAVLRGLSRTDLFTVVHERFLTDTARYADIILPATFSVEQSDCYNAYGYCSFGTAYKAIDPPGQCKSNWDTFRLLAEAFGYEEPYFHRTAEEVLEELLDHPMEGLAGISREDWQTLRQGGVIATPFSDHGTFRTESGKMRIVDESLPDPMPGYRAGYNGKEPLRLVAVPNFYSLNSIFLDREDLMEQRGEARLMLHPADASERGIADGDAVLAANDLAEVPFVAQVTELVAPGTAAVAGVFPSGLCRAGAQPSDSCHAGAQPSDSCHAGAQLSKQGREGEQHSEPCGADGMEEGRLFHINALTHSRISDIGEATTLNDNTVEVRRA